MSLRLFTAPDRDGAFPNLNRKYQTCLIFRTLDRAASNVIPTIANESEQESPLSLDVVCFYSWSLAATNMPWKQRTSPIFFSILFSLWNRTRARRASWQCWLSSVCFSSLVTFDLASRDHLSLWNRSYNLQVCGLAVCSNHLVCAFRGLSG